MPCPLGPPLHSGLHFTRASTSLTSVTTASPHRITTPHQRHPCAHALHRCATHRASRRLVSLAASAVLVKIRSRTRIGAVRTPAGGNALGSRWAILGNATFCKKRHIRECHIKECHIRVLLEAGGGPLKHSHRVPLVPTHQYFLIGSSTFLTPLSHAHIFNIDRHTLPPRPLASSPTHLSLHPHRPSSGPTGDDGGAAGVVC